MTLPLQAIQNLSFQDYKSYKKAENVLVPTICDFNVIIGKNNTGKTSFIDMIEYLVNTKKFLKTHNVHPLVVFSVPLTEEHLERGFSKSYTDGMIYGNHYDYARQFLGKYIYLKSQEEQLAGHVTIDPDFDRTKQYWEDVIKSYNGEWNSYKILRVAAERDIQPETEDKKLSLQSNGVGASNLIRGIINQVGYNEHIIEDDLLKHLNSIMGDDATFTRIQVQQNFNSEPATWEIFLEEKDAGRFALSQSGSGLKTIILILLNLLVIPFLPENEGQNLIYAFEELENNLHPALQRRLFDYLYDFATRRHIPVFLTTHSHVAIDMFCSRYGAQVLHVTKENHESKIKKADSFFDKKAILDDLAIKASDLFQSNGIIWVEGPSDRIYINKWLEIFCGSKYQEGRDFQYIYYGGKLLSHYSADELEHKINILTTNHNSAIVMDSDKKNRNAQLNDTKKRIIREFSNRKLFCWVTKGKEIENYIPLDAINKMFPDTPKKRQCRQFDLFPNYIKSICPNFEHNKIEFSKKIVTHITLQNSQDMLDLKEQIEQLYKQIEQWNSNK